MTATWARIAFRLVAPLWLLAAPAWADDVTVLYGGNRQGAYEPCGCPVKQLGGLGRWATAVFHHLPKEGAYVLVDGGNALFPAGSKPGPGRRAVATLVYEAYKAMKVHAVAVAPSDLGEGLGFLEKEVPLRWLSANLRRRDGTRPFPEVEIVSGDVALVGLTAPATGADFRVEPPGPAFQAAVERAVREKARRLVVVSSLGLSATVEVVGKPKLPTVVVASSSFEAPDRPRKLDGGLVAVELEPEGKHLGLVRFSGDGELVELDDRWKPDGKIEGFVRELRDKQRKLAVAADAGQKPAAAYVADAHRCQGCHQEQYDFWKQTQHASAYLVLYAKGAHFDPECVVCHSLAFEQPGGFDRVAQAIEGKGKPPRKPIVEQILAKTFSKEKKPPKPLDSRLEPGRYRALKARYHEELDRWQKQGKLERVWAGVQCEHCHGSRVGHPENGAAPFGKVKEETCKQCHRDPHHPGFDFAALRPKIACPLRTAKK